jgi:hypothetical protein
MNSLQPITATSGLSGCESPQEIRRYRLVAVSVAVGFQLFCFSVRPGASDVMSLSIAINRFMRLSAIQCKSLQKRKKLNQNPN